MLTGVSQEEPAAPAAVQTTTATQNATSATFSIPRKVLRSPINCMDVANLFPLKSTIMSDNKPHKVTIKILQLEAKFTYTILPKSSEQAFLKVSNTSRYVICVSLIMFIL